ncbi:hypothetical protein lerEdw1_008704 [Lerista edwardsae]|nr:hypothetical protein lerEdw1_008704 [Lerista edwardsae]
MEEAGGAAGLGPAPGGAEELDLSLDDIIKRNRKGQTDAKAGGSRWRQPLKSRNAPYSNGRPRFWSWAPRNLPGPNRFRGGFRIQPRSRKPFWVGAAGPQRRRAGVGPNGRSPLNRPASAPQQTRPNAEGRPARVRSGPLFPLLCALCRPGAKWPFLRGRGAPPKRTRRQPRGVPLRFNFRAMANQTTLTLDERFSGLRLRHRWRFSAPRGTDRMVTLP